MGDAQHVRRYCPRVAEILFIGHDGGIRTREGTRVGLSRAENPLNEEAVTHDALPSDDCPLLIVSSGRMAAPHQTWGQAGATAFNSWCDRLRGWEREGAIGARRALIRPHHADVLSDIQRCLSFARAEKGGLEIAMDPMALLAPSMLEKAADHLLRFRDATEAGVAIGMVVLTNLDLDEEGGAVSRPIHSGLVAPALLRPFAALATELNVPLGLMAECRAAQEELINSWGL